MSNFITKLLLPFIFILLYKPESKAQNEWQEVSNADSSTYYHDFFINGWLLFHKQYHRVTNNLIIDSIQFYNIPDSSILDSKDITSTYLNPDKSILHRENLVYDENNKLIIKIDYIPYARSDTFIRFNVLFFDTLRYFLDLYFTNKSNVYKRNVVLNLSRDTLDDRQYFLNDNKPYKMQWTQFNEQTKVGFRLYEEEYYYKGEYLDYKIRNIFKDDQTILKSYKDVRYRDAANRLILEKYHTFDSTVIDYVLDGYRKVFGAPLLSETEIFHNKKENSLGSTSKIIFWKNDINEQKQLKILSTDGKTIYIANLSESQNTFYWPFSIKPGAYIVQILGVNWKMSKVLLKMP